MATSVDVLVIGGGIIGLTSAYFLAREGLSVEVLDRGAFGQEASWAGAGILPPGNPDRAATPIDRLRAIGSARFPEFSEELRERTGLANDYLRCGGIEFLPPEDEDIPPLWAAEGITFQPKSPAELSGLEPRLRPIPGSTAYHLPDLAQVRNPRHLKALVQACALASVRLTPDCEVTGWSLVGRRATEVMTSTGTRRRARMFLVTSGAWAGLTLAPLGVQLPVHPVRGQIVLFRPPAPLFTHVLMAGKRYLVPRADGRVLAGSTEEPEAGFAKANTPAGVESLVRFAVDLVPDLHRAEIEATWAGLRPGSPDGLPFIGPVPGLDNVFVAAGHFRAGVQLSIGTAELVRDLLTGRPPCVPPDAFRLDRKPDVTTRPAFRS